MSRTRQLIWCFWIFLAIMILWQIYSYNQKTVSVDPLHPQKEHFFYYQSNANAQVTAPTTAGPDVRQTSFDVQDAPGGSGYLCLVTLQNKGSAKAVNVQVQVSPYKGGRDDDQGGLSAHRADNNTFAPISQWVYFPDLAPGQSATQSVTFMKQTGGVTGNNPSPQIIFEAEKK